MLHGITDHAKQAQALLERAALRGAPFVDRYAVNQLHDQIGGSVRGKAAVEQSGDVGVSQMCEHLSLGAQALDGVRVPRAGPDELEGHLLLILAIGTLGAVHRSHAAASQDVDEAPRSEARAHPRVSVSSLRGAVDDQPFDGERAIIDSCREHRVDLVAQGPVGATRPGKEPLPRLDGLSVGELEDLLDSSPSRAVHGSPPVIASARADCGQRGVDWRLTRPPGRGRSLF